MEHGDGRAPQPISGEARQRTTGETELTGVEIEIAVFAVVRLNQLAKAFDARMMVRMARIRFWRHQTADQRLSQGTEQRSLSACGFLQGQHLASKPCGTERGCGIERERSAAQQQGLQRISGPFGTGNKVSGQGQNPARRTLAEAEAVDRAGWCHDGERPILFAIHAIKTDTHVSLLYQQNLDETDMTMRCNFPIVQRAACSDGFHMQEFWLIRYAIFAIEGITGNGSGAHRSCPESARNCQPHAFRPHAPPVKLHP